MMTTPNDNDTQWTIHDCIGPLIFMPNDPTSRHMWRRIFEKVIDEMFLLEQCISKVCCGSLLVATTKIIALLTNPVNILQ